MDIPNTDSVNYAFASAQSQAMHIGMNLSRPNTY